MMVYINFIILMIIIFYTNYMIKTLLIINSISLEIKINYIIL